MPITLRLAPVSIIAIAAAVGTCAPALGQTQDTARENTTAETAFQDPQSPDVYRALSGLGDPLVSMMSDSPDRVFSTSDPEQVALLNQLFPGNGSGDRFWVGGENCRLDQPLATLSGRIHALGVQSPYVRQWMHVQRVVFTACADAYAQKADDKVVTLPPPMVTRDRRIARWQREDRAYQAATALFYGRYMALAAQAFSLIAASGSDQRYYARYMTVAIRAGTQPDRTSYKPLIPVRRSLAEGRALEADRAAPLFIRGYAYDLIGWIGASNQGQDARRAQVDATLQSLEAPLALLKTDGEAQRRYADARDTRRQLFAGAENETALWTGDVPADLTGTRAIIAAARHDRLAEWMVFPAAPWQPSSANGGGGAWVVAPTPAGASRVRAELARLAPDPYDAANPWAHEALMWSDRYDPALWAMIDRETRARAAHDARAVHALDLDIYNQVRTAIMDGHTEGFVAATRFLRAATDRHSLVWTTTVRETLRYLMATGRISEAQRLRDRLDLVLMARADDEPRPADAPYRPYTLRETGIVDCLILLAEDENHLAPLLSNSAYDQAPLLNRLSIAEMARLAARTDVATEWRSALARTAWSRTYALGRVVHPDLDWLMRALNPDITAHWRSRPGRPIGPGDRLALQDVLATPALNTLIDAFGRHRKTPDTVAQGIGTLPIDHNKNDDDDWWCPWNAKANDILLDDALAGTLAGVSGDAAYDDPANPSDWDRKRNALLGPLRSASFLLRSADMAEVGALTRIRCAPELLTERAIDWVEHPGLFGARKGQAETLAAAIVATRWGCDWAGSHGVYSHQAFTLLQARFPDTDAAKKTRFWYACNGDCPKDDDGHPTGGRIDGLPPIPTLPAVPRRQAALVDRIWARRTPVPSQQ